MEKSKSQLQNELDIINKLEKEREISDGRYAPMIVKVIVYGMVGIILVTALGALLSKVFIK
jgi:hypothetical protein